MPAGLARLGGPHLELLLGMVVPMGVNARGAGAVRGGALSSQNGALSSQNGTLSSQNGALSRQNGKVTENSYFVKNVCI